MGCLPPTAHLYGSCGVWLATPRMALSTNQGHFLRVAGHAEKVENYLGFRGNCAQYYGLNSGALFLRVGGR
jgi:hypothetical protein